MSIKHLYPTSTPSLNLNPKSSRVADPRLSCVRNSIGTYVDPVSGLIKTAPANVAHVEKNGLLVEESRTNFFTYSVDLSQQWATVRCSITPNTTVAPDGTTTATTLIEDTASNTHQISGYTGVPQNGNGTHTFSVFAKAKERSVIALSTNRATGQHAVATFDLSSGVVSQYGGTNDGTVDYVGSSIISVGNGWYRCTLTYSSVGDVWPTIQILNTPTYTYDNVGRYSYQGDGTSGIYIWGVQMERFSSFSTSYIPTSGSTVTRAADLCEITGTNFSSWYSQGPNSVVTEFTSAFESPLTAVCAFTDGTTSNRISYRPRGYYLMTSGGGGNDFQFGLTAAQLPANTLLKVGYSLDTTGAFIVSGNASNSDVNTLPMPIGLNQMVIGKVEDLNMYLNGPISRISYYPTRVSDTALQSLTL